jgi:subtilisin family serine protease
MRNNDLRMKVRALLLITLTFFLFYNEIYPSNLPLKVKGKLDQKTAEFIESIPTDSLSSYWIFFKDKALLKQENIEKALKENIYKFPERTLRRRELRGSGTVADFFDLPVYQIYIDSLKMAGVKIRAVSRWLNAVSISVSKKDLDKISEFSFVQKIQKVVTFHKALPEINKEITPGYEKRFKEVLDYGPSYPQLLQIHIPELHKLGFTGRGIRIGMLDTGYYLHHPALKHLADSSRIIATYDFINSDEDVEDLSVADQQRSHGTYTLSALAGYVPDTLIGPAYNSEFVLAKTEIEDQEIKVEEDFWVAGIEWAESLGVDIVSSSLGYNDWYTWTDMDGNTALCTIAADIAVSKGVVVVNSAGNERNKSWHYIIAPADGDSVIAVGAVDLEGNISSFSSAGFQSDFQNGKIKPDVCACGVGTYCANMYGNYSYVNGTSLSAPLVAGACALILQVYPDWSPIQLRRSLWKTATQADYPDTLKGYGVVNAYRAVYPIIYPDKFNFFAIKNRSNPAVQPMSISNPGEGQLKWTATPDVSWLTLKPDSSFITSLCTLAVDISGLDKGVYPANVTVKINQAPDSIQIAQVTLIISGSNRIWVYPNPFSDFLTISVGKTNSEKPVRLFIFNVAGELVYKISNEIAQEIFKTSWNGKNSKGEDLAAGIYLIKVDVGNESEVVKIVKLK